MKLNIVNNQLWRKIKIGSLVLFCKAVFALQVAEVFSFSCSHCYHIETQVKQLANDNRITYVPLPSINYNNIREVAVVNAYFTAITLGKGWLFRDAYFKAVYQLHQQLYSKEALVYALNYSGITSKDLSNLTNQRKAEASILNTKKWLNAYDITVTPSFIVDQSQVFTGTGGINEIISLL